MSKSDDDFDPFNESMGIIGIGAMEWEHFLSNNSDKPDKDDDTYKACTCGCKACKGSGWYRFGRSYKRCCNPCPVHYPNSE